MTYQEAREFLNKSTQYGSVLGLDNIKSLCKALENPENDLKFIHIAGTNGKGSTLAYISNVLMTAGFRTGRYCSPTIFSYRERIQINEENISREALAFYVDKIKLAIESMLLEGYPHPTLFEIETVLAFLYFRDEKCDFVVLETGLGGTLDATNIVNTTICSVITSISMDHMQILGNTIEEITEAKAGIIKPESTAIVYYQEEKVMEILKNKCEKESVEMIVTEPESLRVFKSSYLGQKFSYKDISNIEIKLLGRFQLDNVCLAIDTIKVLQKKGYKISETALQEGLLKTKWHGRLECILSKPLFFIDGAHNEDAAKKLKDSLCQYFPDKRLFFIMGVLADKEYDKIIEQMVLLAEKIITITPNNIRALPAYELVEHIKPYNKNVESAATLELAVRKILSLATEDEDVIVAFGSLSYLGELVEIVEKTINL
ncbi:MAG: bifunctional folylpolyglutamate synthase/dihydrofolate synthase [Clostridiales bacterium]|nr:bifunctional folylpolyglutamate synthase/dihydrofolate synthase [Clostridiales bacterium]